MVEKINLLELLAACYAVGNNAGQVIRQVVLSNIDLGLVNKEDGVYDPQTVADRRAQQRIVYALRDVWPNLQIVGEEGELSEAYPVDQIPADLSVLNDISQSLNVALASKKINTLPMSDIVLWIDPLDGTKKFADKKYDEVAVLIGIAYKQRPLFGIMHLPFHGTSGTTYWGGRDIGMYKSELAHSTNTSIHTKIEEPGSHSLYPHRGMHVTTSGTNCEYVNQTLHDLSPDKVKFGGATGTMVLTVILGESDIFLRYKAKTKRWDICAMEPLLHAMGGKLTDKFGREYLYDMHGEPTFDNAHGLLATITPQAHTKMLEVMGRTDILQL